MVIYIIGGGRTGTFLAHELASEEGKSVVVVDKEKDVVERLQGDGFDARWANACDPRQLEEAGIRTADAAVVTTGHDEDNLVICQLLKDYFGVKRVIARVNHPANQWLYTKEWGVEVAVSATHIIAEILKEEVELGRLVTLLTLRKGKIALVELTVADGSPIAGKMVRDLDIPHGSLLVGIARGDEIVVPVGDTVLMPGDEVIALTTTENEDELARALGAS